MTIKIGCVRPGRWGNPRVTVIDGHVAMSNINSFLALSLEQFFREIVAFRRATPARAGTMALLGRDEALLLLDMLDSGEFRAKYNDRMGVITKGRLQNVLKLSLTSTNLCAVRFEG